MLTWVIAKAGNESSLVLHEHCVMMKTTALRTSRGRLPRLPCVRLALYSAFRGVKTPRIVQRWPGFEIFQPPGRALDAVEAWVTPRPMAKGHRQTHYTSILS